MLTQSAGLRGLSAGRNGAGGRQDRSDDRQQNVRPHGARGRAHDAGGDDFGGYTTIYAMILCAPSMTTTATRKSVNLGHGNGNARETQKLRRYYNTTLLSSATCCALAAGVVRLRGGGPCGPCGFWRRSVRRAPGDRQFQWPGRAGLDCGDRQRAARRVTSPTLALACGSDWTETAIRRVSAPR